MGKKKKPYQGLKEIKKNLKEITTLDSGNFRNRGEYRTFLNDYHYSQWARTVEKDCNILSKTLPILREFTNTACTHLAANDRPDDRLQILDSILSDLDAYKICKLLERAKNYIQTPHSHEKKILLRCDNKNIFSDLNQYANECDDILSEIINFKSEHMQLHADQKFHLLRK